MRYSLWHMNLWKNVRFCPFFRMRQPFWNICFKTSLKYPPSSRCIIWDNNIFMHKGHYASFEFILNLQGNWMNFREKQIKGKVLWENLNLKIFEFIFFAKLRSFEKNVFTCYFQVLKWPKICYWLRLELCRWKADLNSINTSFRVPSDQNLICCYANQLVRKNWSDVNDLEIKFTSFRRNKQRGFQRNFDNFRGY